MSSLLNLLNFSVKDGIKGTVNYDGAIVIFSFLSERFCNILFLRRMPLTLLFIVSKMNLNRLIIL